MTLTTVPAAACEVEPLSLIRPSDGPHLGLRAGATVSLPPRLLQHKVYRAQNTEKQVVQGKGNGPLHDTKTVAVYSPGSCTSRSSFFLALGELLARSPRPHSQSTNKWPLYISHRMGGVVGAWEGVPVSMYQTEDSTDLLFIPPTWCQMDIIPFYR